MCFFSCCSFKIKSLSFFFGTVWKRLLMFGNSVAMCETFQVQQKEKKMRFCTQKAASCYIAIPGKEPLYSGNLFWWIDFFSISHCQYLSLLSRFSLSLFALNNVFGENFLMRMTTKDTTPEFSLVNEFWSVFSRLKFILPLNSVKQFIVLWFEIRWNERDLWKV